MDSRKFDRWPCDQPCDVSFSSGTVPANINNISRGGFSATGCSIVALKPGATCNIEVRRIGKFPATIRWVGMNEFGAEFKAPISEQELQLFVPKAAKADP